MFTSFVHPADIDLLIEKRYTARLSPERLVTLLSSTLHPISYYGVGWTLDGRFSFVALTEKGAEPLGRKGDVSHAGVWVQIGSDMFVAPHVLRLVCQNGLSLPAEVISGSAPDEELDVRFSGALASHLDNAEALLKRFVATVTRPVPDFRARVETLFAELDLPMRERNSVLRYLEGYEPCVTEYDIINAIAGLANLDTRVSEFAARLVDRKAWRIAAVNDGFRLGERQVHFRGGEEDA